MSTQLYPINNALVHHHVGDVHAHMARARECTSGGKSDVLFIYEYDHIACFLLCAVCLPPFKVSHNCLRRTEYGIQTGSMFRSIATDIGFETNRMTACMHSHRCPQVVRALNKVLMRQCNPTRRWVHVIAVTFYRVSCFKRKGGVRNIQRTSTDCDITEQKLMCNTTSSQIPRDTG